MISKSTRFAERPDGCTHMVAVQVNHQYERADNDHADCESLTCRVEENIPCAVPQQCHGPDPSILDRDQEPAQ